MRISQTELADRLGLSTRQIRNLEKTGGPLSKQSKGGRPFYDWPASRDDYFRWKIGEEVAKLRPTDIDEAKRRRETALAERAELEVAQLRGELIPLDLHETRVEALAVALAARCKSLDRYLSDVQRATTAVEAKLALDRISDDLLRTLHGVADDLEAAEPDAGEHD